MMLGLLFFLMKLEGIFQLISTCKTYHKERIRRNFWVGNAGETYHYPNLVKHDVNSPFTWHVFDNFTVVRGLKLLYFLQNVQNHNYEISIRSTRVHDLFHLHILTFVVASEKLLICHLWISIFVSLQFIKIPHVFSRLNLADPHST